MQLTGFHHLTAVTANVRQNHSFYTDTLGLRLVKKTVNQDDVSAYHLFYADGNGSPGTDITFFDWPVVRERRGTNSIVRTGMRVDGIESLKYWDKRLHDAGFAHGDIQQIDGRAALTFEDTEGQRLRLVADDSKTEPAHPWDKSPVPAEHQIRGLGPIAISVPKLDATDRVLTDVMNMRHVREYITAASDGSDASPTTHVYEMGEPGAPASASRELHVMVEPNLTRGHGGAGGVHHVAFRVPTFEEYDRWYDRLSTLGVRSSGPVDRFYFRSLYFREPGGILFELATDGPGFAADEPLDQLGEHLSLPPFLEAQRQAIEAGLKPL